MINMGKISIFEISQKRSNLKNKGFTFNLVFHKNDGLLKQKVSNKLKNFLLKRYSSKKSNNSSMKKSNHRKLHGFRLFSNIRQNFNKSLKNKKILEIGCGSGFLLKLFKQKGSTVLGIEPSKVEKEKNIKILKTFFSEIKFKNKFDIITSNAVLEHEFEPNKFLKKSYDNLSPGGMNFVCVPDYTKLIKNGDPILINHEHISYFTKTSLKHYFEKNGFSKIRVFNDIYGNLYGAGFKIRRKTITNRNKTYNFNLDKVYAKNLNYCLKKIENWINKENETYKLGIYGAISSISTLFSKIEFDKKNIFIFDGDKEKQKKYIDAFPNPIFDGKYIKSKNIKKILILPYFYEKEIKNYLTNTINFDNKNIKCLSYFFNK